MLKKIFSWKPVLPMIYLDGIMNQQRANKMIKKIQSFNYNNSKNIAIVVNMDQALPSQVDKIYQILHQIKQKHDLKLYGFATTKCIPQSYYLLSGCDEIYASEMTIFNLYQNSIQYNATQFYQKLSIKKNKYVSDKNIKGRYYDKLTRPFVINIFNEKEQKLNKLVLAESINNRKSKCQSFQAPTQIFQKLTERDALQLKLIDKVGHHYTKMRQLYPESNFKHIIYEQQKWKVKQFIILLFLFKVFLKYTILTYIYIKAKNKKKSKQEQQMKPFTQYLIEQEL